MNKHLITTAAVAALSILTASASQSVHYTTGDGKPVDPPLPLDGTWQGPFDELNGGVGSFFGQEWTFNGPATVRITDLYIPGDQYNVYDFGTLIASSSGGVDGGSTFTTDPAVAWTLSDYAHLTLNLGAGAHALTIQSAALPSGYADGTYSISGTVGRGVPDVAPSAILLGLGLLGLGAVRRK